MLPVIGTQLTPRIRLRLTHPADRSILPAPPASPAFRVFLHGIALHVSLALLAMLAPVLRDLLDLQDGFIDARDVLADDRNQFATSSASVLIAPTPALATEARHTRRR